MIVSDFIKWLQTQDQEATVEVLTVEFLSAGWGGETTSRTDFDPLNHAEYIDMRGNPFAKGKPREKSRTLFLGED